MPEDTVGEVFIGTEHRLAVDVEVHLVHIQQGRTHGYLENQFRKAFDIDGKPVFCSNEYFADGIFQLTVMRKKL